MFDFYTYGIFAYLCQGMEVGVTLGVLCAVSVLLCMAVGYLLGSINTAIIISKLFFGEDVRNYGSGNAGMTNVLRTYGKKSAALTLLGDVIKTVVAIVIGRFIGFPVAFTAISGEVVYGVSFAGYITALFCVIGHTFPAYYKFKGGKGVATAFGMMVALIPYLALGALALFIVTVWLSHYISLGSCGAATFLAVAIWFYPVPLAVKIIVSLIGVFVVVKHKSNISRLLKGTENKIYIFKKGN